MRVLYIAIHSDPIDIYSISKKARRLVCSFTPLCKSLNRHAAKVLLSLCVYSSNCVYTSNTSLARALALPPHLTHGQRVREGYMSDK
jgi:hypothetical protein